MQKNVCLAKLAAQLREALRVDLLEQHLGGEHKTKAVKVKELAST